MPVELLNPYCEVKPFQAAGAPVRLAADRVAFGPSLKHMKALLEQLVALDRVVKQQPLLENDFRC